MDRYRRATLAEMVAATDAVNAARDALRDAMWGDDDAAIKRARRGVRQAQTASERVHVLGVIDDTCTGDACQGYHGPHTCDLWNREREAYCGFPTGHGGACGHWQRASVAGVAR
jgi:hypothetical protein